MKGFHRQRPCRVIRATPAILVTVSTGLMLLSTGCSESSADQEQATGQDAAPRLDATDEAASSSDAREEAHHEDAAPDGSLDTADDSYDAPQVTCSLTTSGTCDPSPDPSIPECNGCYEVRGQWFDTEARCLKDDSSVVVACSTICTAGAAFACYTRGTGDSTEVLLSTQTYLEQAEFEAQTGFVPCTSSLETEVLSAIPCSAQ